MYVHNVEAKRGIGDLGYISLGDPRCERYCGPGNLRRNIASALVFGVPKILHSVTCRTRPNLTETPKSRDMEEWRNGRLQQRLETWLVVSLASADLLVEAQPSGSSARGTGVCSTFRRCEACSSKNQPLRAQCSADIYVPRWV